MKNYFFLILLAFMSLTPAHAEDVELQKVEDLTTQYFIMAYSDNGTYKSPYWTRGNNQNVMSPRESAIICNGKDYYYLLKAQAVTYNGEKVYRISISNGLHEKFPNGIGGSAYMNSAGWCFFAGESEPSGKSHVYGQDADGLGVWRITYTVGKGFQFQCVGNGNYVSYTMGNSSSANKYYWQCFAEGSLYDPILALKESSPYIAHNEMRKMLEALAKDKTNISCDDTQRTVLTEALATAKTAVDAATTESEILSAIKVLRAAGCTFLNSITLAKGYQLNVTPLLINASFPCNNAAGWDGTEPGFQAHGNAEFWSKSYNFHQTMPDMPQGTYMLRLQGYQRSQDANDKEMTSFLNGTLTQSEGYLYANDEEMTLSLITRDAQTTNALGGTQYTVNGTNYWMPNSMSDANKFFSNGKYWNTLTINHLKRGDLTIGLRSSVGVWASWTCFDNFELYYQGESGDVSDVTYLITNPSFETGTTDGWVVGHPSGGGDIGAKKNEGVYETSGTEGTFLFNTWSISDNYSYGTPEQYVEQTLYDMKPGEYRLRALASSNTYSSVKTPVELYGNDYVFSFIPPSKSEFRQTYEVTIYLTPSEPNLTIGMRSASWFRADNFRLIYFGQTEDYEMERRMSIANRYEEIASQALDRSNYDAVLSEVRAALLAEEITDEEITQQNDRLRTALLDLVKTGTTATGQFDLTVLLKGKGTLRSNNKTQLTTISENLDNMPAGHYTFRANALYRPTTMSTALELYEAGTEEHPAFIFINMKQSPVLNIFDDARHAAATATDIYSTIDGRSLPMTESTAMSAFLQGDYPAVVESDLQTDGQLNVGFRINAVSRSDNWLLASHRQLLYGNTPDTTIIKSVTAGTLTPLCVPFELQSDNTRQLYAVGSILDGQATLYPVTIIRAGEPCVINSQEDIASFTMPKTKISSKVADIVPLPWDGGVITADPANFTWTTTSIDGKTVTKAENLTFTVCDPMSMDFTVNLENLQARRFIQLENYTTTSSSHIDNYNLAPPARRDLPNNVGVPVVGGINAKYTLRYSTHEDLSEAQTLSSYLTDNKLLYVPNLVPQRTYYYEVLSDDNSVVGQGQFHTDGYLRMIYAPSISNIRDLGGWQTSDKKYIRYGLIYRGGEMNGGHVATAADIKRLRNLGIGAEIDLRKDYENGSGKSVFNFTTTAKTFYFANCNDCYPENMESEESYGHWRDEFDLIMTNLRKGKSIYFHCIWGADRTGLLSLLLEGLLGLPKDRSNKNYELTSFSLAGQRVRSTQDGFFNYIEALKGTTLQKKFNTFFVEKIGVSQADIDEFRDIMLTDDITQDLPNAIEEIHADQTLRQHDNTLYDLSGRKIENSKWGDGTLKKGIYIRNGQKVLVR